MLNRPPAQSGVQFRYSAPVALGLFCVAVATVRTRPIVPGWVYVLLALGAGAALVQFSAPRSSSG